MRKSSLLSLEAYKYELLFKMKNGHHSHTLPSALYVLPCGVTMTRRPERIILRAALLPLVALTS